MPLYINPYGGWFVKTHRTDSLEFCKLLFSQQAFQTIQHVFESGQMISPLGRNIIQLLLTFNLFQIRPLSSGAISVKWSDFKTAKCFDARILSWRFDE